MVFSVAPPVVCCFSATDPSGGAGFSADVLSVHAMGAVAVHVLTALTVQDTRGAGGVYPLSAEKILHQADVLLADVKPDCFKIGVLANVEVAQAVFKIIAQPRFDRVPVVLDPVFSSGRGDSLASCGVVDFLRSQALSQVDVVIPNSLELMHLDPLKQGGDASIQRIGAFGSRYLLVTGEHEHSNIQKYVTNRLFDTVTQTQQVLSWPRLAHQYHGSGCTLAASLAAALAVMPNVFSASYRAQKFTWCSLRAAYCLGKGQLIPNRSINISL